jgi:hypothetical protein
LKNLNRILILTLIITLTACEEKGVDDHSRHRRPHVDHVEQQGLSPVTESHVYNWEKRLASGDFLNGVKAEHFSQFLEALAAGVFDPNTVLSSAEIQRIGPSNCTSSPADAGIGLRRFERTLTMAPEFLTMRDSQGLQLRSWLLRLKRDDLLASPLLR